MAARSQILFVAPASNPGGQAELLLDLARCLPQHGVATDVVCLESGYLLTQLKQLGVQVELVRAGRFRDPRGFVRVAQSLSAKLRGGRYDVVVSNEAKGHLYAAPAAQRHRVPAFWFQPQYPDPPGTLDRLATALPAAAVITVSEDAGAAQQELCARRTVRVMHPGINLRRFTVGQDPGLRAENGIPADAVLVSLVGRLQPWKGQREFLLAARMLKQTSNKVAFAVVGGAVLGREGSYPEELRSLTRELGVEDCVTFAGHTTEVHRWMAASDIVVNASQPEPFGLVVIEAMASGCSVVAVNCGGPRDIIESEKNGLLVASRSPRDLADAIGRLVEDGAVRRVFCETARRRVEDHFAREKMTTRFLSIVAPAPAPRDHDSRA